MIWRLQLPRHREDGGKDIFLSRAHATGLETEMLSYAEAQAMSRRLRQAGKTISNQSIFNEVRSRDQDIEEHQRRKSKRSRPDITPVAPPGANAEQSASIATSPAVEYQIKCRLTPRDAQRG